MVWAFSWGGKDLQDLESFPDRGATSLAAQRSPVLMRWALPGSSQPWRESREKEDACYSSVETVSSRPRNGLC